MRMEDALFYVILDRPPAVGLPSFCAAAIAGGVDIFHLGADLKQAVASVLPVCRRDDALLVISDDAGLAQAAGADGALLSDATAPVGQFRAMLGARGLVGVSTRNRTEAMLALEMGVDYLLHWAGTGCAADFAMLPGAAGNALFAAGLTSLEDARAVVEAGVVRLCIDSSILEQGDITANAAAFSRLLGRCM